MALSKDYTKKSKQLVDSNPEIIRLRKINEDFKKKYPEIFQDTFYATKLRSFQDSFIKDHYLTIEEEAQKKSF